MRWNIFDDSRLAFNGLNGAISTFRDGEIRDIRADTTKLSTNEEMTRARQHFFKTAVGLTPIMYAMIMKSIEESSMQQQLRKSSAANGFSTQFPQRLLNHHHLKQSRSREPLGVTPLIFTQLHRPQNQIPLAAL